jgi:hypothetical protein
MSYAQSSDNEFHYYRIMLLHKRRSKSDFLSYDEGLRAKREEKLLLLLIQCIQLLLL